MFYCKKKTHTHALGFLELSGFSKRALLPNPEYSLERSTNATTTSQLVHNPRPQRVHHTHPHTHMMDIIERDNPGVTAALASGTDPAFLQRSRCDLLDILEKVVFDLVA